MRIFTTYIILSFSISSTIFASHTHSEKPKSNAEEDLSFLKKARQDPQHMSMELTPPYIAIRKHIKDFKKYADTGGKVTKIINAYDSQGIVKSLLGEQSSFLDPVTYLKTETGAIIFNALSDPNKQWDLNSIIGSGVQTLSGMKFILSGSALALNSPFVFTSLSALAGVHWAYNIPYVKDSVDNRFFGTSLQEEGQIRAEYPWEELVDRAKENIPYLVCNFYSSKKDLLEGKKPLAWSFAKRGERIPLFPNETESIPETSYYNDWIVLKGRWVRINNVKLDYNTVSIMRFASVDSPYSVMEICANTFLKEHIIEEPITEDILGRIAPQAGYSSSTASYPVFFYAKTKNESNKEVARLILQKEDYETESSPKLVQKSSTDIHNEYFTHVLNLFGVLITNRRFIYPTNWEYLDTLFKVARNLHSLQKTYTSNEAIPKEELYNLIKNSLGTYTKAFKVKEGSIKNLHLIGSLLSSVYQIVPSKKDVYSSLNQWMQGPYLQAHDDGDGVLGFDMEEFHISHLLQEAYVTCHYYPKLSENLTVKVIYENQTLGINQTPTTQAKDLFKGFSLKIPSNFIKNNDGLLSDYQAPKLNTTPVVEKFIDNTGEFVRIKGRWIEEGNEFVFGTLADPTEVLDICADLSTTDRVEPKYRKQKIGSIIADVGVEASSKATETYPLVYYAPIRIKEHGKQITKVLPLEVLTNVSLTTSPKL